MMRKLACIVLTGVFVAACGDDDSSDTALDAGDSMGGDASTPTSSNDDGPSSDDEPTPDDDPSDDDGPTADDVDDRNEDDDAGSNADDTASEAGVDEPDTAEDSGTGNLGDASVGPTDAGRSEDAGTSEQADGGDAAGAELQSLELGQFAPTASGPENGQGVAQLIRTSDASWGQLEVTGLLAETAYMAHLHNLPCEVNGGGTHYLVDPAAEPGEGNEMWFSFTTDASGLGLAESSIQGWARLDARSIVVHDPADSTNRLLCANLSAGDDGDVEYGGEFAPFAAAEAVDESISGSAMLVVSEGNTHVELQVEGLDPTAEYMTHVHAAPCAVGEADGHYLIDPNAEAGEANELWPALSAVEDDGSSASSDDWATTARGDALSVVIHRAGNKVACADLQRVTAWPAVTTSGSSVQIAVPTDAGLDAIAATASMTRLLDGSTEVEVSVTGSTPNTEHGIHVHNLPCSVSTGGSHYLLDPLEPMGETNEVWLSLTTDEAGAGSRSVSAPATLRPEAQSVVVHGADNVRLVRIDLQ